MEKMNKIDINAIEKKDIEKLVSAMKEPYMLNRADQYPVYFNRCYEENKSKERVTFIAYYNDTVAGYVNIIFESKYPGFKERNIPEINDLYVVPADRKKGIGKMLLNACEVHAAKAGYKKIGLGVGLYKDYGSAQRLYTKNGYILDGNGLMYENKPVNPGTQVYVDDELLLYLYKDLEH